MRAPHFSSRHLSTVTSRAAHAGAQIACVRTRRRSRIDMSLLICISCYQKHAKDLLEDDYDTYSSRRELARFSIWRRTRAAARAATAYARTALNTFAGMMSHVPCSFGRFWNGSSLSIPFTSNTRHMRDVTF